VNDDDSPQTTENRQLKTRLEETLADIGLNLRKIHEHGTRADKIVKGMLMHSRGKSGDIQKTSINSLVDEYVNLAYHGMRATDPSFSVDIKTELDPDVGELDVVPQDLSRAILNIVNNACYAVNERKRGAGFADGVKPTVIVKTKRMADGVQIRIHDNGTGIPDHVRRKIFEPFFTTKPTGEGTGLGMSMTYDIIVHTLGGKLDVETKEGEFTEFTILLPFKK
jgi:signal transduction histidine kinase